MLVQSKSILAKLLAKENIRIEHKKVATAYFDLSARLLVCPIWKDMSPELYDLLMGHEVSHCLHTPPAGWHDAIKQYSGGFKTYLNVIEDARIERKIKDLYPGLKPSFFAAYEELAAKEFFGPKNLIQSEFLPFIDRINLHFKIGPFANIYFSSEEKILVDTISKLESWNDVVRISKTLFEMGKDEKSKLKQMLDDLEQELEDMGGNSDDPFENIDFDSDDLDFDENSEKEELEDKVNTLKDILQRMSSEDENTQDSWTGSDEDEDPSSLTDKIYRSKETDLLDVKSRPYIYGNLPEVYLDQIIVPYKKVIQEDTFLSFDNFEYITSDEVRQSKASEEIAQMYKTFMDTNKNYISYLVKEFELRRNAKQYARASTAKTGAIDVKKAYTYKFNADIFKRVTTVPKGKNHGLLMFVDFSGSMTDNIKATIDQTIVLALFCRKVNIPFRVFSFSDDVSARCIYFNNTDYYNNEYTKKTAQFSTRNDDLHLENQGFFLGEYLSSNMNTADFNRAVKMLLGIGASYYRQGRYPKVKMGTDAHIMNGTPLVEATVAAVEITKQFKSDYKLDIVNTIFLTDGEGNKVPGIIKNVEEQVYAGRKYHRYNYKAEKPSYLRDTLIENNIILTDKSTGAFGSKKPNERPEVAVLNILAKATGANVVGFYIMGKPSSTRLINYVERMGSFLPSQKASEATKSIRDLKFAALPMPGYKMQFVLPGESSLEIDGEEMEVEENASISDYKKAFLKMQRTKQTNRVFLNKFIEQIA
jgi:hypothetical protein